VSLGPRRHRVHRSDGGGGGDRSELVIQADAHINTEAQAIHGNARCFVQQLLLLLLSFSHHPRPGDAVADPRENPELAEMLE
jgi:hypothetical protein